MQEEKSGKLGRPHFVRKHYSTAAIQHYSFQSSEELPPYLIEYCDVVLLYCCNVSRVARPLGFGCYSPGGFNHHLKRSNSWMNHDSWC